MLQEQYTEINCISVHQPNEQYKSEIKRISFTITKNQIGTNLAKAIEKLYLKMYTSCWKKLKK